MIVGGRAIALLGGVPMRTETARWVLRSYAVAAVLICLTAGVVSSQTQARTSTQASSRRQRQQNQTMSMQTGQPDAARRIAERNMQHIQEMQQDIQEMQRQAEENKNRALQQTVGASDEQWRRLKPKLDRIGQLKAEAQIAIEPGSVGGNGNFQTFTFGNPTGGMMGGGSASFGGASGPGTFGGFAPVDILDSNTPSGTSAPGSGSMNSWTTNSRSVTEMSEGEAICQELQQMLQGQSVPSAAISQKVASLRRVRAQAQDNLAKARQELRTMIAPNQEPALIMMGYLD
jgi:hypothetical protein